MPMKTLRNWRRYLMSAFGRRRPVLLPRSSVVAGSPCSSIQGIIVLAAPLAFFLLPMKLSVDEKSRMKSRDGASRRCSATSCSGSLDPRSGRSPALDYDNFVQNSH